MMLLPRLIVGTILCIAGLALYMMGGYTIYRAYQADTATDAQSDKYHEICRKELAGMGRIKVADDKSITIELGQIVDPKITLSDISAIGAMCPFQPIKEACLGVECLQAATKPKKTARNEEPVTPASLKPIAVVTLSAPMR